MKVSDAFPSKYLKAGDLPEGKIIGVTIEDVTMEELGQGADKQKKLIISFIGKEKTFVCNKTNANTITRLYGDDTDEWIGKAIGIYSTEVQFGAEMVDSIRVSTKVPKAAAPVVTPEPVHEEEGPEIPF